MNFISAVCSPLKKMSIEVREKVAYLVFLSHCNCNSDVLH